MRKYYGFICLSVIVCISATGQPFSQLKDISPGISDGIYSGGDNNFINLNGTFFFTATDGINGTELWKSDGTPAGTVMVKDINPGAFGSHPANMVVAGNMLYFNAANETTGFELWKSDGTTAGTVMVKDINPAGSSAPFQLVSLGNSIYFAANDGVTGREIWKSDGSAAGTVLVKDVNPGPAMSQPEWLTPIGSEIYFTATTLTNGKEIWKTDGTPGGTVLVKDIFPGAASSEPTSLVSIKNILFFRASSPGEVLTLMKSDGTDAGTTAVMPGNQLYGISWLTNINNTLYFTSSGDELWKSDGTASGTIMLKDMRPGMSVTKGILKITNVNGKAFFSGSDGVNGYELWKSDGTTAGTVMVKDINPGSPGSYPDTRWFYPIGDIVLFVADDGIAGRELWISDGSAEGTYRIQDILPGLPAADPLHIVEVKGRVYISAGDLATGREIWSACLCFKKKDIRNDETLVLLYPNPLRESGTLMICVPKNENIVYRIFDATGRLIQIKKIALNQGSNMISLETNVLAGGTYIISIDGSNTTRRLKFIKQ